MKKLIALCVSLIALAFALPAGAATAQKVQIQPDKAIATAPVPATRFILAAADAKTKDGMKKEKKAGKKAAKTEAKTKKKAVKKEVIKKTGTGFRTMPRAPVVA